MTESVLPVRSNATSFHPLRIWSNSRRMTRREWRNCALLRMIGILSALVRMERSWSSRSGTRKPGQISWKKSFLFRMRSSSPRTTSTLSRPKSRTWSRRRQSSRVAVVLGRSRTTRSNSSRTNTLLMRRSSTRGTTPSSRRRTWCVRNSMRRFEQKSKSFRTVCSSMIQTRLKTSCRRVRNTTNWNVLNRRSQSYSRSR